MTHEEMMEKAWKFINDLEISDKGQGTYNVEDIYQVRDAYYADLESGHDLEGEDMEGFLNRHNIEEVTVNLYMLTGQESGIVIYDNKAVIVCNWANICPSHGLPMAGPIDGMLMCWPPSQVKYVSQHYVDDIRDALPGAIVEAGEEDGQTIIEAEGMDIVSDENGDLPALWGYDLGVGLGSEVYKNDDGTVNPTPGTVYELEGDVIIIAPERWC